MKKIFYLMIIGLLVNNTAFAVTTNANVKSETSASGVELKSWMKTKNGRVKVFDTALKVAIINNKTFKMVQGVKVYDGPPLRGSRVKFNINEQNMITELWVVKK